MVHSQKQIKSVVKTRTIEGPDKKFLTVKEAAVYTGLSKSYFYKLIHYNIINYYKVGSKVLFLKEEIDNYILNNKVTSNSALKDLAIEYTISKKKGVNSND
tara:strand:+ start:21 stop:323 length:303 start_codon:yes stop_codon:yes gene_type:complete